MQNRHQAQSRCKLLLLQKTIFVALTNTGQRPVADLPRYDRRAAARPERSAKGATASGQNNGGAERDRTADPLLAKQMLSQLSYSPNHLKHPSGKTLRDQRRTIHTTIRKSKWWARVDLNYRPHAYQACALTN